jgi:hypothetical protein
MSIIKEMEEKDNLDKMNRLVKKILSSIKPNGVLEIKFKLEPISDDEYYLTLKYIVPDDSPALNRKTVDDYRHQWTDPIHKTIQDYLGISVFINQIGISSKSFSHL